METRDMMWLAQTGVVIDCQFARWLLLFHYHTRRAAQGRVEQCVCVPRMKMSPQLPASNLRVKSHLTIQTLCSFSLSRTPLICSLFSCSFYLLKNKPLSLRRYDHQLHWPGTDGHSRRHRRPNTANVSYYIRCMWWWWWWSSLDPPPVRLPLFILGKLIISHFLFTAHTGYWKATELAVI